MEKLITKQKSVRATKHLWMLVAPAMIALTSPGCGDTEEHEMGLYVYCNGHSDGLHYDNPLSGPVYRFSLPCIDPDGLGETGGFDLEEWTNDTEDIDELRSMCVQHCNHVSTGALGSCEQEMGKLWQIENHDAIPVPDPLMLIDDPEHLECRLYRSGMAPRPWETTVIPSGSSPLWPNSGRAISLTCHDYESCAEHFVTPVENWLYYDDTQVPWGPDMGSANYLATVASASSMVTITIKNRGATPSSDSHTVESGRIEYSAPRCGEATCPFYLANLTLANRTDVWELYSNDLMDDVHVTDVSVQLRRPSLGVWNTSTSEFYLGRERVEMWISGTLQIGEGAQIDETYLVANVTEVHGKIGSGGGIEILGFTTENSEFKVEADLDYATLAGSPPVADHGLSATVVAPSAAGIPLSSIADMSWDPDGDIDDKFWVVDGVERAMDQVISTGTHEVELWAKDSRGALDSHASTVVVEAP